MADSSKRQLSKRNSTKDSRSDPPVVPKTPFGKQGAESRWAFLSNHTHVLVCLARDPEIRLRDVAQSIGITERAVQNIVSGLEEEGLVKRHREGRRNHYELNLEHPLRHPVERHRRVADLVNLFLP